MKLILHIGMPKAGSSALQDTLRAAAPRLRQHGVLYPADRTLPKNHNILVCGFLKSQDLPRLFRQVYGDDTQRMERDFTNFEQSLQQAVSAAKPDTLILSSEMLFRQIGAKKATMLETILHRFSNDIKVVAYVRQPSQFYMSRTQQGIKASSRITPLMPIAYRRVIESYERISNDIEIVAYERATLHEGDITKDFLRRVAPAAVDVLQEDDLLQSNQTISAEGMDVLHRYRIFNHSDKDGRFTRDTGKLIRLISAVESELGGFTKPVAHAPVRAYLDTASADLLWLRERFGVNFASIDYDRISSNQEPPCTPQRIADICALDEEKRDQLMMLVLNRLTKKQNKTGKMRFKAALPGFNSRQEK